MSLTLPALGPVTVQILLAFVIGWSTSIAYPILNTATAKNIACILGIVATVFTRFRTCAASEILELTIELVKCNVPPAPA